MVYPLIIKHKYTYDKVIINVVRVRWVVNLVKLIDWMV